MKTCLATFLVAAHLFGPGCSNQPPQFALQDGLAANMSDEQILRVLQLDPSKLQKKKEQGPDGHSIIYTDEKHEIWITRSVVSGLIVMRMKPEDQLKAWELGSHENAIHPSVSELKP